MLGGTLDWGRSARFGGRGQRFDDFGVRDRVLVSPYNVGNINVDADGD